MPRCFTYHQGNQGNDVECRITVEFKKVNFTAMSKYSNHSYYIMATVRLKVRF